MPTKRQRALSRSDWADEQPSKRQQREPINIDDDDDLEAILAQIREQEESEALARKLQNEWNNPTNTGESSRQRRSPSPITFVNKENTTSEDDETLARRLAEEWAREDSAAVHQAASGSSAPQPVQTNRQPLSASKRKAKSPADTPAGKLEFWREFFVGSRNCTECGHEILTPRGYVTYTSTIPPPSLVTLLHVSCPSCETNFCRGCARIVPCPPSCKGKSQDKSPECPILTCCAEGCAIALFEALGGFDRHYLGERATSDLRSKEAMASYRRSQSASVGPGGTGYGTGRAESSYGGHSSNRGHGRGRGQRNDPEEHAAGKLPDLDVHADMVVVRALSTVTSLLPAPYSDSPEEFDIIPHESIAALILASQLPELLGSLLRNDSVTDWTSRSDVYNAMLSLLRRMSDCELTLEVLIGQRYEMEKSGGIEEWMWGDADISWARSSTTGNLVPVKPLYAHFQKLTKQCETFLSGASRMLDSGQEPTEDVESLIKSMSLCGEIIAARDDLERAMKALGKDPAKAADIPIEVDADEPEPTRIKSMRANSRRKVQDKKGKTAERSVELERRYAKECERLAFHHVVFPQENGTYTTFNYANLIQSTANATRNPKDRLHMIKELAVMATSLPPGVWVRVDEVRNDALKVMIAGPEGTPYAGGLFEFDCFLTLEYPNKPPLMHLRTTGGGSVRFNPNLYNNGKVCLSLLGTWQGRPEEQWSRNSTLLQVLVSIQSMILIDLPFFNEPGYGQAKPNHPPSIEYNKNISMQTVRWAMVEWLKDEHKDSIWADVIKTHFSIRAERIRADIQKWIVEEPRILSYVPTSGGMYGQAAGMGYGSGSGVMTQPIAPLSSMNLLNEFERGLEKVAAWDVSS